MGLPEPKRLTTDVGRERLKILVGRLREECRSPLETGFTFDMGYWGKDNGVTVTDAQRADVRGTSVPVFRVDPNCGTAACACGLATTIDALHMGGKGLSLVFQPGDGRIASLYFNGLTNFAAAAAFFEIDRRTAERFFDPGEYGDRNDACAVARRLSAFLARDSAGIKAEAARAQLSAAAEAEQRRVAEWAEREMAAWRNREEVKHAHRANLQERAFSSALDRALERDRAAAEGAPAPRGGSKVPVPNRG